MLLEDRLIEKIIKQNLGMLFSDDMFKVRFEPGKCKNRLYITIHQNDLADILMSATIELDISTKRDGSMRVMSMQFYCENVSDTFKDFIKCCEEIQNKIEEFNIHRTAYIETDDGIVVNFTEIGIDNLSDFTTRDLFIKRNGDISYVQFDDGMKTTEMTYDEFKQKIAEIRENDNLFIDLSSATIINFVDYDHFETEDD